MNQVLIINGPNLNWLGRRDHKQYGQETWQEIFQVLANYADTNHTALADFQSNHEGDIIDKLQETDCDCVIINAGAYTHYSYAIRDAIAMLTIPVIEVHMSNIYQREEFRKKSVLAPVCVGQITGFKSTSYLLALQAGIELLKSNK